MQKGALHVVNQGLRHFCCVTSEAQVSSAESPAGWQVRKRGRVEDCCGRISGVSLKRRNHHFCPHFLKRAATWLLPSAGQTGTCQQLCAHQRGNGFVNASMYLPCSTLSVIKHTHTVFWAEQNAFTPSRHPQSKSRQPQHPRLNPESSDAMQASSTSAYSCT